MTSHTNHTDHLARARHRAADSTAMSTLSWASDGTVRAFMFAPYQVGAFVVPTDLPRAFVCQITQAYSVEGTPLQVLELRHFDGPWPRSTKLVRGSDWVRPAVASEVVELRRRRSHAMRPRRRRGIGQPGPIRLLPNSTQSSSSTPTGTPIR
jgi:hypothetical protein